MAYARPIITAFTGGELSPLMYGRVDINKYAISGRMLRNLIPLAQGPMIARPGTRFIARTKNDAVARLIPFEFSTEQAYIIEASAAAFRFYRDGGRIESPPGTPVEVVAPYAAGDLAGLRWAQSADVLYLAHGSHKPRTLSRTSHTAWALADFAPKDGPYLPVNIEATTLGASAVTGSVTITASGVAGINKGAGFATTDVGRLVAIAGAATAWAGSTAYNAGDVVKNGTGAAERVYRCIVAGTSAGSGGPAGTSPYIVDGGAVWEYVADGARTFGHARITAWTSTTQVTATVLLSLPSTTATKEWRLGAWSDTTGWPRTVCFYGGRLWWGGTANQPQTLWASRASDYESYRDGALGDDALVVTIDDDKVNAIRWLAPRTPLTAGTTGGIFNIRASTNDEALTPSNLNAKRQDAGGVADLAPLLIGQAALYPDRAGRAVLELSYNFEINADRETDLSVLAEHLLRPGVAELAFQRKPWRVVWVAMADGTLRGLTYMRDQQVVAWHRHELGGTAVKVLSVATIPGAAEDELWLVVERSIAGGTRRFVERLDPEFRPAAATDVAGAFYLDAGLTYQGVPVTTVSGLDHLEGQTVQVLADGATHPDRVVSAGAITLARQAGTVHAGLFAPSRYESLDFEAGAASGAAQGAPGRVHGLVLRLWDAGAFRAGYPDDDTGQDVLSVVEFRTPAQAQDAPVPLWRRDWRLTPPSAWNRNPRIVIDRHLPLPLTVAAIVPEQQRSA